MAQAAPHRRNRRAKGQGSRGSGAKGGRPGPKRWGIAGIIFIANFAGVAVLVLGSLLFNELRTGLTQSRVDALRAQSLTIASVLAEAAVPADAEPVLDERRARAILKRLFREPGARLRLFDRERRGFADSRVLYDEITVRPLPPIGPAPPDLGAAAGDAVSQARVFIQGAREDPTEALAEEVATALEGRVAARERFDENGERVVSVSVPIQRVRAVVGVLTMETADVTAVVEQGRRALYPFIASAILVAAVSATMLAWSIARPLRRLAIAADHVRSGKSQTMEAPELAARPDEIGELANALADMTATLQERINANESFAADVAHEIKNPLAAIRNAAELLPRAQEPAAKEKLERIILADARRVDRLVTDIANASRLDAELARAANARFDLADMIEDMGKAYGSVGHARDVTVAVSLLDASDRLAVMGRQDAISRVLTNLLDNALSFSPPDTVVSLKGGRTQEGRVRVVVEDQGPGVPPEALEAIFRRFYTHRPRDTEASRAAHGGFGDHSGLGLAIARQIAESHGGRLWAENLSRGGARFVLDLPRAPSA
jgi:two-component system sensor histidine kinase ChvG